MSENVADSIQKTFVVDIQNVASVDDLKKVSIAYLGRKGKLNSAFELLKNIPSEEKRILASTLNSLKTTIEKKITDIETNIISKSTTKKIDVTLPGNKYRKGSLHITTYAIDEIIQIFSSLGFIRMSYPEVEWEYYAFEALNMPKGHPARDDFETFFLVEKNHPELGKMVLTPHTSNGQIREMLRVKNLPAGRQGPPIKMINIARTYRPNWDVSHVPMFHQFEGLCIDKGINMTNLKGTIEYFTKEFFGANREIRLRPFHFQFTEPSFEVDITCGICNGTGEIAGNRCKLCKSGWLELGGTGMVHRNVLKAGGIDHTKYSGWAFGFGVERVMMMKHGLKLDDIRILYNGDIRFLEQF